MFERLAEKIMQDLAPHADIKWDDHIPGEDSEILRQIDVSVRWKDGDEEHLLIIDAKDWSKPADVGDIEKFAGMVKDVRASRGILVCNAGFSQAAHTYAGNLGVGLCNLHDAESRDWSRDLTIPIVWTELTPRVRISSQTWLDVGDQVQGDEHFPFVLSFDDGSGEKLGASYAKLDVIGTFARAWNSDSIPRTVGEGHEICEERPLRALVRDAAGVLCWRPLRKFSILYTVQQASWLGQFRPSQCRGLINYLDGQAFVASYLPIGELPVERDETWEAIENADDMVLDVRGTVVTTSCFQTVDDTTGEITDLRLELIKPSKQPE